MRADRSSVGALAGLALLAIACHREEAPASCALTARPRGAAVGFDANSDGTLDVADGAWLLARNFRGGEDPPCLEAVEAFGDAVTDSGSAYAMWYALISGTAVPELAAGTCPLAPDVEAACGDGLVFGIDAPERAGAASGQVASFAASVTLRSPDLPVEAWSVSVEASGCTVGDVEVGAFDAGLAMAQQSAEGAVSLVVLDPIRGTTVNPDEATAILNLTVQATVGAACATCTLGLVDGQAGAGRPISNAVSASGRSYSPETNSVSVEICPTG